MVIRTIFSFFYLLDRIKPVQRLSQLSKGFAQNVDLIITLLYVDSSMFISMICDFNKKNFLTCNSVIMTIIIVFTNLRSMTTC